MPRINCFLRREPAPIRRNYKQLLYDWPVRSALGIAIAFMLSCGGTAAPKPAPPAPAKAKKPAAPDPAAPPKLEQLVDKGKGLSAERMKCPESTRPRMVFTTGKLVARCETVHGKPLGPVFHFHKGGSAAIHGQYAKGNKQVGTWRHWDVTGALTATEEFDDDGKLLRTKAPETKP